MNLIETLVMLRLGLIPKDLEDETPPAQDLPCEETGDFMELLKDKKYEHRPLKDRFEAEDY